jgi:hypothetical protein
VEGSGEHCDEDWGTKNERISKLCIWATISISGTDVLRGINRLEIFQSNLFLTPTEQKLKIKL